MASKRVTKTNRQKRTTKPVRSPAVAAAQEGWRRAIIENIGLLGSNSSNSIKERRQKAFAAARASVLRGAAVGTSDPKQTLRETKQ